MMLSIGRWILGVLSLAKFAVAIYRELGSAAWSYLSDPSYAPIADNYRVEARMGSAIAGPLSKLDFSSEPIPTDKTLNDLLHCAYGSANGNLGIIAEKIVAAHDFESLRHTMDRFRPGFYEVR